MTPRALSLAAPRADGMQLLGLRGATPQQPPVPAQAPAQVPARQVRIRGEFLVQALVRWTLPLWVLGVLTLVQAYVLCRLAIDRWPRGRVANLIVFAWGGVALTQCFAALLVGLQQGTPLKGLGAAFGTGTLGWAFGAIAIAAGAGHQLCGPRIVRSVSWMGLMILLLALLAGVSRLAGLPELYLSPAPLGMLVPHSTMVRFYTSAAVFIREETLGEQMTRLILFFPWATALGLGGLGIFYISALERSLAWRVAGMAGGLVGVVFSWSRIAMATWVAVAALMVFWRAGWLVRLALIGSALLVLLALPLCGIDPFVDIGGLRHAVDNARAGSSMARDLIYQKSWEGFLESPWIGNGWIGDSVHRTEELPIGSHSTIYGLLYTGGLPTFLAFATAVLATLVALLTRLFQFRAHEDRARLQVGVTLVVCLAAFSPFEQLFSLTVPCFFMFTWIGACVGYGPEAADPTPAAPAPDLRPVKRLYRALHPRNGQGERAA